MPAEPVGSVDLVGSLLTVAVGGQRALGGPESLPSDPGVQSIAAVGSPATLLDKKEAAAQSRSLLPGRKPNSNGKQDNLHIRWDKSKPEAMMALACVYNSGLRSPYWKSERQAA